ncbi:MAG: hypothetical protein K6T65_14260 [Peptococcaceae bacterium]|nr:hypothetical protein [Peptococcaceae bacterium]
MKIKPLICGLLLFLCFVFNLNERAYAGNYSYTFPTGLSYDNGDSLYQISNLNIVGYNITQGFAQQVAAYASIDINYSDRKYYVTLYYTLPDDGSYWQIKGNIIIRHFLYGYDVGFVPYWYYSWKIDLVKTTSGFFSGYSSKTATDAANTAASNASTAATNAVNAYNAANDAKNAANSANTNAASAASRTWDTVTSKSAATLAREARDNIPVIISKVQGQGGATCASGTSFTAVVSVTPGSNISYSVSCAGPVTPSVSVNGNNITFGNLTAVGAYTATITATNTVTGGTATTSFTFFKV